MYLSPRRLLRVRSGPRCFRLPLIYFFCDGVQVGIGDFSAPAVAVVGAVEDDRGAAAAPARTGRRGTIRRRCRGRRRGWARGARGRRRRADSSRRPPSVVRPRHAVCTLQGLRHEDVPIEVEELESISHFLNSGGNTLRSTSAMPLRWKKSRLICSTKAGLDEGGNPLYDPTQLEKVYLK